MFAKILVPIDGSTTAQRGLQEALGLARALKSSIVLLHVVDVYPMPLEAAATQALADLRIELVRRGEQVLQRARDEVEAAGVPCETALREVIAQRAADAILEEAATRRCDLVVMGSHGRRGLARLALGSDATTVLRESPVPVLVVRQPPGPA